MSLVLYTYWRSSAAYRVRITLNLKGLDWYDPEFEVVNVGLTERQVDDLGAASDQPLREIHGETRRLDDRRRRFGGV